MIEEEWRDIILDDYNDAYQVSNLGNVRRKKNKRLLQSAVNSKGYEEITLTYNGRGKNYRVHRLVAQAFLPNPDNLPYVNHKNEIKLDNRAENLEWCTPKYNSNYGTCTIRQSITLLKGKKILCLEDGKVFNTYKDVQKAYGILHSQSIYYSCKSDGVYGAYGYHFQYI